MGLYFVISIILILQNRVTQIHGADWDYEGSHGPAYWSKDYAACGGRKQSPINFPSHCDLEYDANLKPFVLNGFTSTSDIHTVKNNGHALQVDVSGYVTVSGGGLSGTHRVAQFHFHWGADDTKGSEHFQNGIQYPLELHIVTFNLKYPDLATAVDKSDGLAVLGFWFEVGEINNCNYQPILDKISQIRYGGNSTSLTGYKIRHIMPETFEKFYRYQGSLTTPPCYESVTWTVFEERIKLSTEQFALFRTLFEDDGNRLITLNYRPLQQQNTRKVFVSYKKDNNIDTNSACKQNYWNGIIMFVVMMFIFK